MEQVKIAPDEAWVDAAAIAQHLSVNVEFLYAEQERLGIPRVKLGNRRWRYKISEVDRHLQTRMQGAA